MTTDTTKQNNSGLLLTFWAELTDGPVFHQPPSQSTSNDTVDVTKVSSSTDIIQRSFFPSGPKMLLGKLLLRGWSIAAVIYTFSVSDSPRFELAFLTNWSLIVTVVYMALSLFASTASTCSLSWATPQDASLPRSTIRATVVNAMAVLFPVAAVQELLVALFWVSPHSGFRNYSTIVAHGPLAVLVFIDGLYLNQIPVRARHIGFVWGFQCLYLIWSGVYSILDLMNPTTMTMDMDEAIYEGFLNWRLYPAKTLLFAFGILVITTPVAFGGLWSLSFYSRRKQATVDTGKDMKEIPFDSMDETDHDEEDDEDLEAQGRIYEC